MFTRNLFSGAALVALTACGGGSGGGSDGGGVVSGDDIDLSSGTASYVELVLETERLTDLVERDYVAVAPNNLVSDVEFNGIVLLADDFRTATGGTSGYVGQVELIADVSSGRLSGTASNFFINTIASDGSPGNTAFSRDGELTIDARFASSPNFDVDVGGNLEVGGSGNNGTLRNVDGTISGNFFGPNSSTVDAFAALGTEADGNDLDLSGTSDTLDIAIAAD